MGLGDPGDIKFDRGPEGLLEHVAFALMSIVGAALAGAAASAAGFVQRLRNTSLRQSQSTALTPSEAAVGVVKGHLSEGDARAEAALGGVDSERFAALVKMAGNPPGPETLLDLWRRGIIDGGRMVTGLREGFLLNEWIDVYQARRFDPLSATQYLQGSVEGHLDHDEAIRRAGEVGVDPDDAELIYQTLGNPPGIVEMLHLWKRGFVSEDEVDQAIRESHYKNKYIPAIKHYADYFPPPRTITTLLAHGAMTSDQALQYFKYAGLSDELAAIYVASAVHTKTATHKELAVGTVKSLYALRVLSRADAVTDLAKIGYEAPEANLVLDLADAEALAKIKNQAIEQVRSIFVHGKITDAKASEDLSAIGVDPTMSDHLLQLWRLEQTTPSKQLTVAQLTKALNAGRITAQEYKQRLVLLGYPDDDAQLLLDIEQVK